MIKVYVVKSKDRKNLRMRYDCPIEGKQIVRSTGTADLLKAERIAAKWEAELQEHRYLKSPTMGWEDFRQYHSDCVLLGMKQTTVTAYVSSLNVFERLTKPARLADFSTPRISVMVNKLRSTDRSPATIARHLRHLKAIANWAKREELLPLVPRFTMPKLQKGMRGRPISRGEFDSMLGKVKETVGAIAAPSWRFYLEGLWTSGLRLEESLTLRWEPAAGCIAVDYSHKYPMLQIPAEAEKGSTNRLLPITPEFAGLLDTVADRQEFVFQPEDRSGKPYARSRHMIGPRVSAIGKAAEVITDRRMKAGKEVLSYAGAHDLRRSFGFRWSRKIMPVDLRELMRHESINTTMKYYVGENAEATAEKLWNSTSHSTTQPEKPKRKKRKS